MLSNNNDTRRFSYAEPVLYKGSSYPSADTTIVDDRGIERKGRIFADANGEYYTLDSKGNALPAMLTETLPEVEITPSREEALSTMFDGYLTRSDKTRVNNVPHREYNPWLRESSQKGAREHALWDKEHPNLAAWRDFGTAIPFGVAAAPLAGGLSETALGQAATRGLGVITNAVNNNTFLPWTDAVITSGFGAKGLQDISNGTFNLETAIDLIPMTQLVKPINNMGKSLLRQIGGENNFSKPMSSAQRNISVSPSLYSESESTLEAAEKGRNQLLDWVGSPYYKQRLENETFFKIADNIAEDASKTIKDVPFNLKDRMQLSVNGNTNGTTSPNPKIGSILPDDTHVIDFNTGLNINIASDLGEKADRTALHELLHYMTANTTGSPTSKVGERIIKKGWMEPTETHYDAIKVIHKNRSKGWQDYIIDQNNSLLPKRDQVAELVMEEPEKAKTYLVSAGKSPTEAEATIKSLQNAYSYWYDIQEQRAYLQELFISKIRPNLKNPNDAMEIETYLSKHPEILENSFAYKNIQEMRPGSLKQYAKYFASALSTLPFINKLKHD